MGTSLIGRIGVVYQSKSDLVSLLGQENVRIPESFGFFLFFVQLILHRFEEALVFYSISFRLDCFQIDFQPRVCYFPSSEDYECTDDGGPYYRGNNCKPVERQGR